MEKLILKQTSLKSSLPKFRQLFNNPLLFKFNQERRRLRKCNFIGCVHELSISDKNVLLFEILGENLDKEKKIVYGFGTIPFGSKSCKNCINTKKKIV